MRKIKAAPLVVPLALLVGGCCLLPVMCKEDPEAIEGFSSEFAEKEAKRLANEVRHLSEDFGHRYYNEDANMAKVRAYIRNTFAQSGAVVEEQEYNVKGRELFNVRAFIGNRSKPRIVVGAHYDSCGTEGHANPGADDNASGVAGLFGLARLLKQEAPADVCVELVAYSSEEPPYFGTRNMGSYRHAKLLSEEEVDVRAVLVLEMIGYFSDETGSQKYPTSLMRAMYPSEGNFISVVGGIPDRGILKVCKEAMKGAAPLPVVAPLIPRGMGSVHLSDHRNYWEFDYPAVMIGDTAFYRNPHYHQPTDTWDRLDYKRMAYVVIQTHRAVIELAK